ncbi:hypothetical protein CGRAC_1304 [Campylobacter gracilis]|nr:hypothetical protein CGRAC_1304 [Campylobacter gracilis]
MEFYQKWDTKELLLDEFQFPTGWDSTWGTGGEIPFEESFNSQRDGILLGFIRLSIVIIRLFQFPTDRLPAQFILIKY